MKIVGIIVALILIVHLLSVRKARRINTGDPRDEPRGQ